MSLPTPPLALSPTYLALLQARPAASPPGPPEDRARAPEESRPAPPAGTGRGRLVDILV